MRRFLLFISLSLVAIKFNAQTELNNPLIGINKNFFIENKGQWSEEVLYLSKFGNLNIWITKKGFVLDFFKTESKNVAYKINEIQSFGQVVKFNFTNSNPDIQKEATNKLPTYYNYFIGKDKSRWASNVDLYETVRLKNIFDGIDVIYFFEDGYFCYNFIVHPGADYKQIQINVEGLDNGIHVLENDLFFDSRFGRVEMKNLYVYQKNDEQKQEIAAQWLVDGNVLTFDISNYDVTKDLIIDPVIYSTFIGGTNNDEANVIKVDEQGYVYIAGLTASTDFPTTPGAYNQSYNGGIADIFISLMDNNLGNLIFSTFLGGTDNHDGVLDLTYDAEKNIYFTGWTKCWDYPTTTGVYDTTPNGNKDVIVAKLSQNGSQLLFSTVIGQTYDDVGYSIAIDKLKTIFVCGHTDNLDFPTTANAYQTNGGTNLNKNPFVLRFNSAASQLFFSTFIGGVSDDIAYSLVLDAKKNVYITGHTYSSDFPITLGQNNATASTSELFVSVIDSLGQNLLKSRTFGGSWSEFAFSIKRDNNNNIYVCGSTTSPDFPVTSNVFSTNNVKSYDAIVVKFSENLNNALLSTFIGGDGIDEAYALNIDQNQNIYIVGTTAGGFPTTPNAYSTNILGGNNDIFITKFKHDASALLHSTYFGGNDIDKVNSFTMFNNYLYLTGYTHSTNFPTTANVLFPGFIGNNFYKCAFVSILEIQDYNTNIFESQIPFEQLIIYPNPVDNIFTVISNCSDVLNLYDVNGKIIASFNIKPNKPFVFAQKLSSGIYMLRNEAGNISKKIIVK